MGLASYIFMIAEEKGEVNGWLLELLEISVCDKLGLYILHKMRIAERRILWYIVITKKKEVSPKYSSD